MLRIIKKYYRLKISSFEFVNKINKKPQTRNLQSCSVDISYKLAIKGKIQT